MKIKMLSSAITNDLSYECGATFTVGEQIEENVANEFIAANLAVEVVEKKPKKRGVANEV